MSRLVSVLFPQPTLQRSPGAILRWWESRRLTFNLVVGATGLVTLSVLQVAVMLPFHMGVAEFPWKAVLAYGIAANCCYSLGPLVEATVERWMGRQVYEVGPVLWRHGLIFSMGLTLFPIALAGIFWLARIAGMIAGRIG